MAGEKTVYVKVGAKVDGAVAGLRKVQGSINDLTKSDLKKPQAAFDGLSSKAALAGGAIAFGIGKAVSSFADFDQAMSGVAANSGATGAQLDALRDQAIKLGSDTQFSATEAAQGINELAKAGVSSQEILNGGLKGALDLAAAGQIGVAQAAETTASALNQFEQDGSQATHVADLLSNAANAAQGGVGDMGQALGQAGVAAHAAGLDIDETTTLLALFAKAGLIGSDAGTSLKTMMQRLSAPTDAAASAMESLGISAYDAQGNFVGAENLVGQLADSTKNLSTETKMAAFNTIFGSDAIRAASIASAAGADGYKKMATEVTKAGGAAENAAKLTDNLKGDIERLGGSIETAFITSGSSANGALRTLTQSLGGVVDKVAQVPAPILLASTGLAALALTVPKGISAYRDFAKSLDTMGISMEKISAKAPRTAKAIGIVGKAAGTLAVAATAVYAFAKATDKINADKLGADLINAGAGLDFINKQLAGQTDNGWGRVGSDIDSFGKVLGATFDPGVINNIDNTIGSLKTVFGGENVSNINNAAKQLNGIDTAMAGLVSSGHVDQAKAIFAEMTRVAQEQGITVEQLQQKLPQYATAISNAGNAADGAKGGIDGLNDATGRTPGSAASADSALQDLANGGVKKVGDEAKDAKTEMQDLLNLVDSMAGGKRALAADKRALAESGDAAIKAAKDRGGNDPEAVKAAAEAKSGVSDAQSALTKARKGGKKEDIARATKDLARAQDALVAANKRVADSYVSPAEAQSKYAAQMEKTAADGDALIHELMDQKKPISEINAAYDAQRAALIKAANARGYHGKAAEDEADKVGITVQQMDDLRFQYAHTQEFVDTQVRTPGLPEAKKGMQGYYEIVNGVPTWRETKVTADTAEATEKVKALDKLRAKPEVQPFLNSNAAGAVEARLDTLARTRKAEVTVDFVSTGKGPEAGNVNPLLVIKKATGGPVHGPGTGTSDTAGLFALSNNEHVLTAAEVAAAGGHGAIYALRKAILTGGVQFRAAGGPANASAYRVAPTSFGGGSRGIDYDRLGAAVAAQMPPQVSVYSGHDAKRAARTAISDWEWGQTQ